MATIWLTYAWEDNTDGDVDFIAQEIMRAGVAVKLDRWNLGAGKRLWEQIESFITKPSECDGWVLYATQASLGSEPCKEEFAYALGRAVESRSAQFPVIGLFPSPVDKSLIPAAIKSRLYLSTTDPDWKERLRAAAENRSPTISETDVPPYSIKVHQHKQDGRQKFVVEVRPRAGTWAPFVAAVPAGEKASVNPAIMHGPQGRVPTSGVLWASGSGTSDDAAWWFMFAGNEATPTQSYFIFCDRLPSRFVFGVYRGQPQYVTTFAR
jgi:hypothetical protein